MTKEYLSRFIGYITGSYNKHHMHITLIRKEWYLPNRRIKYEWAQEGNGVERAAYTNALAKVEQYFLHK